MFNQNFAKANMMSKNFLKKAEQLDRQEYSKGQENIFSFNKERKYKLSLRFFWDI